MASYNKWNGVPMLLHPTAKTVLAGEWGLDGIFSTDLAAVGNLVNHQKHVATIDEALAATIKAGYGQLLWFAMMDGADLREVLGRVLERKLVSEADIDEALRGKFRTLIRLGLLDPPGASPYARIGGANDPEPWTTDAHKTLARDVARASVVLLKNAGGALPLDRAAVKSIAVLGPRAAKVMTDFYGGPTPYSVSVLDGIKTKVGTAATVTHADGRDTAAATSAAKAADVAIVVVGNDPMCGATNPMEMFNNDGSTKPCADKGMGREGRDRESLELTDEALIKQVFAANPKTIVVLVSSFPYAITWSQANVPAILHITHAAQEQGTAIADVLFGDYNPGGHLTTTWPASLDRAAAVRVVRHPQGAHLPVLHRPAVVRVRARPELLDVRVREPGGQRADAREGRRRHDQRDDQEHERAGRRRGRPALCRAQRAGRDAADQGADGL